MSDYRPRISLVIPIYNGEKYVDECLSSIVRQSFSDFECIIVDDGSTDSTLTIIKKFNDSRIKVVQNDHKGSSHARNSGFALARGEFVMFLDSDDFFYQDMLQILHRSAMKNDADVVICNYKRFDTVTKKYSENVLDGFYAPRHVFKAGDIPRRIFNIFSGVPWNKLYRKDFLVANRLTFAEDLVIGADSLFVHESLLLAKKIFYVDDCLISYRVNNPQSDVARARAYIPDIALTIDKLYAVVSGHANYKKYLQSLDNWAMGKCIWIYELDEKTVGSILEGIIGKYGFALHPDDYYYSPSDIRTKILQEAKINAGVQ